MPKEIVDILRQSGFDESFINYVRERSLSHHSYIVNPYQYDFPDNPLIDISPTKRVLVLLNDLLRLKEKYDEKGVSVNIFYDSLADLQYRIDRYYTTQGVYGLSDRDILWLRFIFREEIYDLGSLRFQKTYFSYAEIERTGYDFMPLSTEMKNRFAEGIPIINVHIMKDTDLSPKSVEESFQLALTFFKKYFPNHRYTLFTCRTWMLYKPMQKLLSDDSNIVKFANKFEIIASNRNSKQALDRIYETSDLDEIVKMRKTSSLAQVAYKNIDLLGVAAGVIYVEDS